MLIPRASGVRKPSSFERRMVHYKRSEIKHGLLQTFRNVPPWNIQYQCVGTVRKVVMNHFWFRNVWASFRNLEGVRIPEALIWSLFSATALKNVFCNKTLKFLKKQNIKHLGKPAHLKIVLFFVRPSWSVKFFLHFVVLVP